MAGKVAYEFGGFRFEPSNLRLVYGPTVLPLTAKAADILTVLVTQPDSVVSKDDLMAAVWPDAVVEENNLNQQISVLRKALAQNGNGSFIETVPRRGYRFTGTVRVVPAAGVLGPQVLEVASDEPAPAKTPTSRLAGGPAYMAPVVAAFLAVGVTGFLVWGWQQRAGVHGQSRQASERGDQLLRQGDARAAVAEFQLAIRLDPQNAPAYSALAHALHKQSFQDSVRRVAGRSPSVEAAQRAVSIDPQCAECHGTLGFFLFYHDWQWSRAEEHFKLAIRLGPQHESIRPSYAMLLAATGRVEQAQQEIEFALSKQPYRVTWHALRAHFLYLQRRYAEALAAADGLLALNSHDRGGWEWRSRALFQMGRRAEAVDALAQVTFAYDRTALDRAARAGDSQKGLRRLLEITEGKVEQTWRRAPWHALLNEQEEALRELELACEYRNYNLIYIGVDPVFDRVRGHSRFRRILVRMGLDSAFAQPPEEARWREQQ